MPAEWWRVGAAALPLIALLVGLLILRWPGVRAGLVALVATLVLAATVFATSPGILAVALWRAAALSLNVLYIVWAALLLYQVTDSTGAIKSIGDAVAHLTEDHILQLLIIGFAFSSFLQGVAGFGVPVAVTAPLLIGLGFDPLEAAAIPLVGHAWAVTMGALASAFQALLAVTGLPAQALATWIAILLGLTSVATGFAVAHIHAGLRPFRRAFGATLTLGVAMGATQLLLAFTGHWVVASFAAGMVGLAVSMGLAKLARRRAGYFGLLPAWPPPAGRREPPRPAPASAPEMPFRIAFLPYYLLIVVVTLAGLVPPVTRAADGWMVSIAFPRTATGLGWITAVGRCPFLAFGQPGALLLYTTVMTVVAFRLLRRRPPEGGTGWRGGPDPRN